MSEELIKEEKSEAIKQTEAIQKPEKIQQNQFHSFVFGDTLSWQEIIYDLINTEQLDPWDIDVSILAQGYLEKIKDLEEANFVLSSKVLIIASLMLRIKSELLINRYIKSLDDILFGTKQEIQEKIQLEQINENELPELIPRTPMPRFKKISIQELMAALGKAIQTEERREYKKQTEREIYEKTKLFMPKKKIKLSDQIKNIHNKITTLFQKNEKIRFSDITGPKKQEKIDTFIPLLHLDHRSKLWLQQHNHFEEIWIHKDGREFMQENEIITDNIERQFEESLEK